MSLPLVKRDVEKIHPERDRENMEIYVEREGRGAGNACFKSKIKVMVGKEKLLKSAMYVERTRITGNMFEREM